MKRKSLIMLVCAIVVMSSAAFGTIAYLTDRASVKNTFTVGNVDITLDEADTNEAGQPLDENGQVAQNPEDIKRVEDGNNYKLVPAHEYTKDPTVTVKAGKEPAYIRMVVEISKAAELDKIYAALNTAYAEKFPALPTEQVTFPFLNCADKGWENDQQYAWQLVSTEKTADDLYRLTFNLQDRLGSVVSVSATENDLRLPPLFTKITVPGEVTGDWLEKLNGMEINVLAQAIQADGFNGNANAAWEAFNAQSSANMPTPSATTQVDQGDNPELPPVTE